MRNGGGLRLEADFFRKSNNLTIARERKIRTIQLRTAHVVAVVSLLLGLGYGSLRLAAFLVSWDRLAVRELRLQNPPRYAAARARAILQAHRGNILTLDLAALRTELLALPEVREVALSRVLPGTLVASFELRRAEFAWQAGDGLHALDVQGADLQRLAAPEPGLIPVCRTAAADVPRLAALFPELQPLRARIESVAWCDPYGAELKLAGIGETLYPGDGDFQAKIDAWLQLKRRLRLDGQAIRYADLRMRDRIYFEPIAPEDGSHEK